MHRKDRLDRSARRSASDADLRCSQTVFATLARALLAVNDAVVQTMLSSLPFDEMRTAEGALRPHYRAFADWLERTPPDRIAQKRGEAERIFHRVGITFAVYGERGRAPSG